jgi:1-acyl-sn-glycerol-3-phosphate acyltransferase
MPVIIYFLWMVGHMENQPYNYSEQDRYDFARRMISIMKHRGRIQTNAYGVDNLPEDGGYIMYANHQGKYDALGIISVHDAPCTIIMDAKRSQLLLADQFITLLNGCRLDKSSMKAQMNGILNVIDEVKDGRRYIIFPEGGYGNNKNKVQDFLPGSFKCALKSESPIVPVALIDSYKPFGVNSLKKVTTQVHFLEPIYYETYKDMTTQEISRLVRYRIMETISANQNKKIT